MPGAQTTRVKTEQQLSFFGLNIRTCLALLLVAICSSHAEAKAAAAADDSSNPTEEPASSKVHVVDYDNFMRFVRRNTQEKDGLVLMEFYAPWCGHCQELAPKFREAAAELDKLDLPRPVTLAKYDDGDDYNRQLRAGAPDVFNYTAYPALIVFDEAGGHEHFLGGREADQIVFYMRALSEGLDPLDEELKARPGLYKKEATYDPLVMVDLEAEFFDELVLNPIDNDVVWVVEFYSDNCPFCKQLTPEFIKASKEVAKTFPGNKVRFGGINSRIFDEVADRFEILSWPWVASFYGGEKTEDMRGLGGAESIVRFAKEKHEHHRPGGIDDATARATMEAALSIKGDLSTLDSKKEQLRGELQALLDLALEFNLATTKKVENAFQRIEEHETTYHKAIRHWTEKLEPLLALKKRLAASEKSQVVEVEMEMDVEVGGSTTLSTGGEESSNDGRSWREILGSHTWFFLHTVAAKYPDNPTEADKQAVRNLVAALGQHYPCALCREHLQQKLRDPELGAVAVDSHADVSVWFCRLHNAVNADLGKDEHDCAPFGLDLIYLKDCGECKKKPKGGDGETPQDGEAAGPWDAGLYASDPEAFVAFKSQQEMWDAAELDDLLQVAQRFNIISSSDDLPGSSHEERVQALDSKLRPLLALRAENAKLKKQLARC